VHLPAGVVVRVALAALAAGRGALKPGEATGKLTVSGESAALTHAYLTPDQGSAVVTLTNIPVGLHLTAGPGPRPPNPLHSE
jgi:hypothetical protein